MLLIITSAVFLASSATQYIQQAYRNISWTRSGIQLVRTAWTKQYGDSLVVELRLSRPWSIVAGQHVYLTLLTLQHGSILQRHPFVICWWRTLPSETKARSVFVVMRQQRGWTRSVTSGESSTTNRLAWLQGPFGSSYELQDYGTVIMFASGDGIFAQLPLIRSLVDLSKISATKVRRMKLVWQTDEYHDQLQEWMQSILDDEDVNVDVSLQYIDGKKPLT